MTDQYSTNGNAMPKGSGADKPTALLSADKRGIPARSREQYERNQQMIEAARKLRESRRGSGGYRSARYDDGGRGEDMTRGRPRGPHPSQTRLAPNPLPVSSTGQALTGEGIRPSTASAEIPQIPQEPVINGAGFDGVVDSRVIPDAGLPTELITGVLELQQSGQGFLRPEYIASNRDVYVSPSQVRRFGLRHGDMVAGQARQPKENERFWGLLKVETVNGMPADESNPVRRDFEVLESEYPNEQIVLTTGQEPLSTRMIDLLAPIGKGQRGLIVSPPKAGKTTLLKDIAAGVAANYPEMQLIALLIGERPEEVTDMRRTVKGDIVASNFDHSPEIQVGVAELGLARAKRLVEMGKDVIIIMDSITRLARAYNLYGRGTGRTMSGGFDAGAIFPAKKFLGAARKIIGGGSLTIMGTALVETGSRMDDMIYEEFKGTGNMELHLERKLAERRIYPAIQVMKSGTRQEELLYDKKLFPLIMVMRRMLGLLDDDERTELLLEKLKKAKTNEDFLKEIQKAG